MLFKDPARRLRLDVMILAFLIAIVTSLPAVAAEEKSPQVSPPAPAVVVTVPPASSAPATPSATPATPQAESVQPVPPPETPSAPGQDPRQQNTQPMRTRPMRPGSPVSHATGARPMAGMVTLNFDDADVYTIIQTIFGEILKVDYVVDQRIKGRVTFRSVAPIPVQSVLPLMEVVLRINGIGIVEDAGLYRLVPIGDVSKEPAPVSSGRNAADIPKTGKILVHVIPFRYLTSTEAVKLVTPFVSANAVLIDVPKTNQIIIVDTDANIRRILTLVDLFDSETQTLRKPQVYVQAIQNGTAKDVAALLQQIFLGAKAPAARPSTQPGQTRTAQPAGAQTQVAPAPPPQVTTGPSAGEALVSDATRIFADEVANTVIVLAVPEDYRLIKETLDKIDTVPRQVVIEGMIAAVNLKDNLSLGVAAVFKGNVGGLNVKVGINPGALSVTDPNNLSQSGFTFVGTDGSGEVRALITALATDSKAKLLATPHILVSDNREAKIQVGQSVPLVTAQTFGTPGVAPVQTIQYRDIGIILKVKPRVNEGGLVALELYQEVSTFETITLGVADKQIIINKTDATTNLVVQDNQTIVIGGLIREDKAKSFSGVPFLSRIPVIGWIFGSWDDTDSRQELIILLTPRVIRTAEAAKEMTSDVMDRFTATGKGQIPKDDLLKSLVPAKPAPPGNELPR